MFELGGYQPNTQDLFSAESLGLSSLGQGSSFLPEYNIGQGSDLLGGAGQANGSNLLGNIGEGIGAFGNLANIWMGFQQLRQGKKQFAFQKGLAETNLRNQAKLTNGRIADRQAARLAYGGGNYASVADALNQYGVSGEVGG